MVWKLDHSTSMSQDPHYPPPGAPIGHVALDDALGRPPLDDSTLDMMSPYGFDLSSSDSIWASIRAGQGMLFPPKVVSPDAPLCIDSPQLIGPPLHPISQGMLTKTRNGDTVGVPLGRSQSRAEALLLSFKEAILRSVRLLFILFLRALLKTGAPLVRQGLETLGLGPLISEAECGGTVDEMISAAGKMGPLKAPMPLLLPRHENDGERLTIVLDLDETLVCAYNTEGLPPSLHQAACQGGIQWFTMDCASTEEQEEDGQLKVHNVTVYQRPGLKEFLAAASQLGELVLFTAGLEGYARPLVDRIDPEGRITHRLYRSATVSTYLRDHVKDLSLLGRDLRRTVLIDNNPFSFLLQPLNGVPCVAFTGEDAKDQQLQEAVLPLLEQMAALPDIRPYLMARFHMPAWFRIRGIPMLDTSIMTSPNPWMPASPMPPSTSDFPPCAPMTPMGDRDVEGLVAL